jgi:hypothetical protein
VTLAINILLWLVVGALAFSPPCARSANDGARTAHRVHPAAAHRHRRGSGFVAEVLLKALIAPGSVPIGAAGASRDARRRSRRAGRWSVFPFAAALKSSARAQVIAYSTAWALYAIHRLVIWEVPLMPARIVWLRAAVSLPLPFMAAAAAMLLGKP